MHIKFGDKELPINPETTLAELLIQSQNIPKSFAVVLNQKFICKSSYDKIFLQQGDSIQLITPMQGG